ncbi:hypothetical protein TWF225_003279 [Orbilia oligospora]|nr:hypothetical protein TWF225_003279 [Orbilia oligospora]KAF3238028.1 hypothetical protein TWF128_000701 [Orbilia oligospora]KAF3267321.1 hypothetical protein TWF217_000392 [Orbilia oligospora]
MAPSGQWLQLYLLSLLSVPSLALPNIDHSNTHIRRKDYQEQSRCQFKPLGFVHPYPDSSKSIITITKQGQVVTTYTPTATKCSAGTCKEVYCSSTYRWYSTWLPGPSGLQFVTRGDDTITLPPVACATSAPRIRTKSHYCKKNGVYTIKGKVYQVHDAPKYIKYAVETVHTYLVSDVDSYFQWLHNKTSGVRVNIKRISCVENTCTHEIQTWQKDQRVNKEVKSLTAEYKGYCGKAGACTLSAQIPGYGKNKIVVTAKSKGPATCVSAQELTITRTHVVTNTVTRRPIPITRRIRTRTVTKTKARVSSSCTFSKPSKKITLSKAVRKTTICSSAASRRATPSPSILTDYKTNDQTKPLPTQRISEELYIAVALIPSIGSNKAYQKGGKLAPDYFVRFDNFEDGNLTFSKNECDALPFSLSNGELTANGDYLKALVEEDAISISLRPESVPVRMSTPGSGDTVAAISTFYDGYQRLLIWGTQRLAAGTALAQFCIQKDASGNNGQIYVFWDAIAPKDCSLVALFILDGFVPSKKPSVTKTITRTSSITVQKTKPCPESLSTSSQVSTSATRNEARSSFITSSSKVSSSTTIPSARTSTNGSPSSSASTETSVLSTFSPNRSIDTSSSSTSTDISTTSAVPPARTPPPVDEYSYGDYGNFGDFITDLFD